MKGDQDDDDESDYFSSTSRGGQRSQDQGDTPASAPETQEGGPSDPNLRRRVLNHETWDQESGCGSGNCNHESYSIRAGVPRSYTYDSVPPPQAPTGYGGMPSISNSKTAGNFSGELRGIFGGGVAETVLGDKRKMSTTKWLAQKHNIQDTWLMCV